MFSYFITAIVLLIMFIEAKQQRIFLPLQRTNYSANIQPKIRKFSLIINNLQPSITVFGNKFGVNYTLIISLL